MTRQRWTIGAVAAAFTLSLAPMAWAQAGGRPNTSGSSTGSAVSRGGEGGSSGSSSGGSSSSSGSMGSGGSSSSSSGSSYGRSAPRERAPQNPAAVPRGSRSSGSAVGRASGSSPSAEGGPIRNRADVPTYSRPRDGRNVTGSAIERGPGVSGGGGGYPIYPPYYPCYSCWGGYWGPGYGYGFGLGYYSWYDPFYYGAYGAPWGYGYTAPSYGAGGYSSQYRDLGNLRLKVKPSDAQVYVDGYYVGVVDSFDGVFQKLGIESGAHKIELRAEGYETVQFEVFVTPGETVTYKGEMKPKTP